MGREEKPIFTSRHPYHGLVRFYHSGVDSNRFIRSCLCASEIWRIVLQWLVVRRSVEVDYSDFNYGAGLQVARTEIVFSVWNVEVQEPLPMRLGLIPSLAMAPKIGSRIINARAKTVAEKPAFRNGLRRRRCMILADGYYEWQKTPVGKRPFQIVLR